MKSQKKANVDMFTLIIGGLLIGALIFVIMLYALNVFESNLPGTKKPQCENSHFWDGKKALSDLLKNVDDGEYEEFLFYNENCKLVSFSFVQGVSKIQYPQALSRSPKLCLCEVEDEICNPYDCYEFKNYEQINYEQFLTEGLDNYVFLKFVKDGKTLRIDAVGEKKESEAIVYTKQEPPLKTDPQALINRMSVIFESSSIKNYKPIVSLKESGFLVPQGVPNVEGFTTFFDLNLALPPSYGQTEEDYLLHHENIDPNIVKQAYLELVLQKEKWNKLATDQKENVTLYYKVESEWKSVPMKCEEQQNNVLCGTILNSFSNNFAVSTSVSQETEVS